MPVRKKKKTGFGFHFSRSLGFLVAVWAVVTIIGILVAFFILPFQRYTESFSFGSIRALVFSPKYISVYEDEELRFAFENPTANAVTVTFGLENNSALPGFLGLQESSTIYAGTIQSRQQINRQTKVFFHADISQLGELAAHVSRLGLWGSIDGSPVEKKELEIYFAPIPFARSLGNVLGTAFLGLAGLLVRELWDQLKKTEKKR
jgi:hypothetical protein